MWSDRADPKTTGIEGTLRTYWSDQRETGSVVDKITKAGATFRGGRLMLTVLGGLTEIRRE
jgi:hypothetical protein